MNSGLSMEEIKFTQGDFSLTADLNIPEGKLACLLGPSGSGKTTMLRLIAGFEEPAAGVIRVAGRNITPQPPEKRKLGIVFQDYALFPHMSVEENITYGIKASGQLSGIRREERRKILSEKTGRLLELVRLPGYESRRIDSLSGGEQQRIALARALAPEPDLLLLDEPLSALDVQLRTALRSEIKRIQKTLGITTLYITHDQEEAMAMADMIFIMNNGEIQESGKPEDLYIKPENLFTGTFLGISNILEGTVEISTGKSGNKDSREDPGQVFLNTGGQKIGISPAGEGNILGESDTGKRVKLFFRPQDCVEEKNGVTGRVVLSEYRGPTVMLLLMWKEMI